MASGRDRSDTRHSGSRERFLVTGALGCVGAWTVRRLVDEDVSLLCVDVASSPQRLRYLLSESELGALDIEQVDIADQSAVEKLVEKWRPTNVIHLAALQIPSCRADPALGARVNVLGFVNIFEALRRCRIPTPVVYASSIATFDAADAGEVPPENPSGLPATLYGVFKLSNEATARVYWQDHEVASVGLRPYVVYGVGRDQGLTSEPTTAMLHAAAGRDGSISYGGENQLQYADDVAAAFIAATRCRHRGAAVLNLPGTSISMSELAGLISKQSPAGVSVTAGEDPLPFPASVDTTAFEEIVGPVQRTPIEAGIRETIERFADLERLRPADPGAV